MAAAVGVQGAGVATAFASSAKNVSSSVSSLSRARMVATLKKQMKQIARVGVASASLYSNSKYDLNDHRFAPIKESILEREMTRRYMTDMITHDIHRLHPVKVNP